MNPRRFPALFAHTCVVFVLMLFRVHAQAPAAAESIPILPGSLDKRLLDTTADPCVNFAQYACGRFATVYPLPADQPSYDDFTILYEHTQFILRSLLSKVEPDLPSRTPNEQKFGDFYSSCMDTIAIQAAGLKPFQPELDRIAAMQDKREITSLLAHFQLINVFAFFSFREQQDFKDSRKQIAAIFQGGLGLPERDYYLRTGAEAEKTRKQYVDHITNMLKLLGESDATATSEAKAIMALETSLARVSQDVTSMRDPNNIYHPTPVAQLTTLAPGIDWPAFFAASGAPPFNDVNISSQEFLKGLDAVIKSTDLATIKAYLRWQFINGVPNVTLPSQLDAENFNFYGRQLSGSPQQRDRWKLCVQSVDDALGEALGEVYVKNYFTSESKARTVQMVKDIEAAIDKEIGSLSWMSAATQAKAREKLHRVANKIGYPEKWRDYSSLRIVPGDMLGNAERAAEFESHRQLSKIGKPVDRGEWLMTPPTINAYYNSSMNDINFPAGILQSPFFSPAATDAENYGHAGAIVGHELTHGFDDRGRKFDGNGNLAEWWTPEDSKKFEAMANCEVKEYSGFTAVDDLKLNGKLTLGENTADNGGVRLALVALSEDALRKHLDLDVKDSSGYTPTQQFFLADAQNWCATYRPESLRLQVQTDPHSPDAFRTNGVVQNMPEFGKAFGCKTGQPMMPVTACHVW